MNSNYNPMIVRTHISLCGAIIYTAAVFSSLYIQSIITGTSSSPIMVEGGAKEFKINLGNFKKLDGHSLMLSPYVRGIVDMELPRQGGSG